VDERFAYVSGKVVPIEEAVVSVSDRGVIYGDGLYETIRAKGGECVRLALHLDRLFTGARTLGFPDDLSKLGFASAIAEVLEANSLLNARVRVTVTRGRDTAPGGMGPASATQPTVIITAYPLIEVEPQPCHVVISSFRRDETSPLANVKTINCLPSVMALAEAQRSGASDAILLNTQGNVAEGSTANVFIVNGGHLTTPSVDQGCLPGTVRSAVLGLAPHLGLEVSEGPVRPEVLNDADEVFFTSAIRLVRPIGVIDGRTVGSGDKVWRLIREALLRAE
jgi:branched-chain amino acid aminotransferase